MTEQELIARLRLQSDHIPVRTLFDDAADRIEELVKERDEALAKLTKAMEMLQSFVDLAQHGRFVLRELEDEE